MGGMEEKSMGLNYKLLSERSNLENISKEDKYWLDINTFVSSSP